ncbi:hypothetical protein G7046_g10012 [Stylonectria norvegica]|nr:hypothetical protein G7046_g10012 [Stylonectria norvegica]
MDVAYNQHADRARRKNRSSTNLNHLTLAPLTVKLPLNDDDLLPDAVISHTRSAVSYLQGKSAPTTPRLLSHSPTNVRSRSHHRTPSGPSGAIAKSKSASHLASSAIPTRKSASGLATPSRRSKDEGVFASRNRNDSDWLLRTGALMSSEAREYKGQTWLVSRQSSTSLTGIRDAEDEAFEQELARERDLASRHASRRGSYAFDEDASPYGSRFPSRGHSRAHSRTHSRSHSLTRSRSQLLTPLDHPGDESYFPEEEQISGPDFVNLDERLEELEQDTAQDDEAAIRRLVRRGQAGAGSWMGSMWSLFSVEENDEESDDSSSEMDGSSGLSRSRSLSSRNLTGISSVPEERIPPPRPDEGGWRDAAWLLSVASKVMF